MIPLIPIALIALVVWKLAKNDDEVLTKEKESNIDFITCPANLCEFPKNEKLEGNCSACGFCFSKIDTLKEKTALTNEVLVIGDLEETYLESFFVKMPLIINVNGEIKYQNFELEPKTLESLKTFAIIEYFAKMFDNYDGLKLSEGGIEKLAVDHWRVLGYSLNEAEEIVYSNGKYPSNESATINDIWFTL